MIVSQQMGHNSLLGRRRLFLGCKSLCNSTNYDNNKWVDQLYNIMWVTNYQNVENHCHVRVVITSSNFVALFIALQL